MSKNIYLILTAAFFTLCLAVIGGVWWSMQELKAYREEYDMLEEERATSQRTMDSMQSKNVDLEQITGLNIDNAGFAQDSVEFYSKVRQAVEKNNVELISMNASGNNENILSLQLQGSYYDLARTFAEWRVMPFASRINSLKIKRNPNSPTAMINAQVTLEAMMEEK